MESPLNNNDTKHNIAARAGRWSAKHRKTAILLWFVFVIGAVYAGSATGQKTISDQESMTGESKVASALIDQNFKPDPDSENVLVSSDKYSYGEAEFDAALEAVVADVSAMADVGEVRSPMTRDGPVSEDGHAALVQFDLKFDPEEDGDKVTEIVDSVNEVAAAHAGVKIQEFGDGSFEQAFGEVMEEDFARAQSISLPLTLGIMLFAFGALVAAGLPVLLAITSVAAGIGLVNVISQIVPVDEAITEVVLLIGMAVGVDYSLFYLKREREERAAGRSEQASIEAAAATSGRAVLISGFTVIPGVFISTRNSGMFLAGTPIFSSFAVGTILVVAIAMIGSLTVLPAMLSVLGDKVDRGRIPFLAKSRRRKLERGETGGIWSRITGVVLKRPAVAAVLAAGLLIAAAVPALQMETRNDFIEGLPQDLPVMQGYKESQKYFPQNNIPAEVVIETGDVTAAEPQRAIGEFVVRVGETPGFVKPAPEDIKISDNKHVAVISVPMINFDDDEKSIADLKVLRDQVIPDTLGSVSGATVAVTGDTAESNDFTELLNERLPIVIAFVLGLAFLLLLVTFRSVVIPITSILLNLLSISAAYGVMVLVFQHGWGHELLGFEGVHPVTPWLPLFMFVILFGLSMDYHVFILSRIREGYDRGMSTDEAIASGIRKTAGVVTSAAAVMVAVFAIFGTLSMMMIKQMGVGLSVAVLIDATIVRAVLLPSVMALLGNANWYLPRWLKWLPEVRHEGDPGHPITTTEPDLSPRFNLGGRQGSTLGEETASESEVGALSMQDGSHGAAARRTRPPLR